MNKNTDTDICIIGAGVVGLAVAARLSERYKNIFVIEKHPRFGQETSSRNSEVIHSGIYYPTGSLKAKLCVKGKDMLYETCRREEIPHERCGKLIVATSEEELPALEKLQEQARINGVFDLELLDTEQVKDVEPHVFALKALLSPSTGIVDTHSLMKYFESTAIKNGVDFAYKSQVKDMRPAGEGYEIDIIDADDMPYTFSTAMIINCGGLEAVGIADMLGVNQGEYNMYFCKGEYFRINPPHNRKVGRLVYPVPFERLVGLGIHATTDLGGGLKLGPNAIYLDENVYDYSIDGSHKDVFFESAKKFLPFLEKEHLSPDSAGLRPKIQGPGQASKDFIIRKETEKGHPHFINLIGIESPGLTSSMAIAEYVEELVGD